MGRARASRRADGRHAPPPASGDAFDVRAKLDAVRGAKAAAKADGTDATVATATATAEAGMSNPIALDAQATSRRVVDGAPSRDARASAKAALASIDRATGASNGAPATDALPATSTTASNAATAFERLLSLAVPPGAGAQPDAATATAAAAALAAQPVSVRGDATTAAAPANATMPTSLQEQVGTPAWNHEVGQATLRMAANDLQNVSLRLNPEHLGPLDVQMRIDDGVAHLQFAATHADTRHALESSRTTLDQMLGQQGIKLGDWSVGQQSSDPSPDRGFDASASTGDGRGTRRGGADGGTTGDATVATTIVTRTTSGLGLVDTFA